MNYEYLKELPDFSEHCDDRYNNRLPSISEIKQRHYLMQGLTSLDVPITKSKFHKYDSDTITNRPYFRSHIYPETNLDSIRDWRFEDQSIKRIIDENTGRPTRYYHHGIDNLNFLSNNFYQNPDKIDLKLKMPRRGFAGSIVDRAMYW